MPLQRPVPSRSWLHASAIPVPGCTSGYRKSASICQSWQHGVCFLNETSPVFVDRGKRVAGAARDLFSFEGDICETTIKNAQKRSDSPRSANRRSALAMPRRGGNRRIARAKKRCLCEPNITRTETEIMAYEINKSATPWTCFPEELDTSSLIDVSTIDSPWGKFLNPETGTTHELCGFLF